MVSELDPLEACNPVEIQAVVGPLLEDTARDESEIKKVCSKLADIMIQSNPKAAAILAKKNNKAAATTATTTNGQSHTNGVNHNTHANGNKTVENGDNDDDDDEDDDDEDDDEDVLSSFGVLAAPIRLGDLMAQSG